LPGSSVVNDPKNLPHQFAAGLEGRIDPGFGGFFVHALPGGDAFVLGRFVGDWAEAKVLFWQSRI
jgi:hypothetical protein